MQPHRDLQSVPFYHWSVILKRESCCVRIVVILDLATPAIINLGLEFSDQPVPPFTLNVHFQRREYLEFKWKTRRSSTFHNQQKFHRRREVIALLVYELPERSELSSMHTKGTREKQ